MTEMLNIAQTLFTHGYTPLRLEPNSKFTKASGWSTHTPSEQSLRRDFGRPSNMGIRVGDPHPDNTFLVAIDIDIEDAELIRCVERAIGEKVPVKRGKKGATYFVRLDREIRTSRISLKRDGKNRPAIDVLAMGAQTVIPPSIHPETGKPYVWLSKKTLENTPYKELPIFTPALLDEIRGFAANPDDKIYALNDMEWAGVGGGGNTHDVCLAAVSSMVARKWTDEEILMRIDRAKAEACEAAGLPYHWPEAQKTIQEWIDSSRDKKFDTTAKKRKDDVPLDMINNYVYVVEINRMYDLSKNVGLSKEQFDNKHWSELPKPWATMITCPDLRIVDKLTYNPGQPRFCKERSFDNPAILDCLNIWVPADIDMDMEITDQDVAPWLDLVYKVFDNDQMAISHVLNWMAYMVQHPGERINHAIVVQGAQGIGKDSIFMALGAVLGMHNYTSVTLDDVESDFNDWAQGNQLIIFQEMLAPGRRNIYNKLKTIITDSVTRVNMKFMPPQKFWNRTNYVFLTNYKHALSIDPDDRRMFVWYSDMLPQPKEYYEKFYQWLADKRSASALYHYLVAHDTSGFNPTAAPPITKGKEAMIQSSGSELEQYLQNAYENNAWPLTSDLVNIQHLLLALRPIMRTSSSMLKDVLDHICGGTYEISLRPRYKTTHGRVSRIRLLAIRNKSKWARKDGKDLIEEYLEPLPPSQGETEGGYNNVASEEGADSASSF